jgi:hypothetical protein
MAVDGKWRPGVTSIRPLRIGIMAYFESAVKGQVVLKVWTVLQ